MSLFGAKPATQPSSGFTFGSNASNQPSQPSTFGSNNNHANNTVNGTANSTINGGTMNNNSLNNNTLNSQPSVSTAATSTFAGNTKQSLPSGIKPEASSNKILKDLLDSAHNLPKRSFGNIESINLTLNELQRETLHLRNKEKTGGNYTKAHYLLSGSGINAADLENDLSQLPSGDDAIRTGTMQHQQRQEVSSRELGSIENYLVAKKEENILSAIEQSLASASKDFDQFINQNISIDWKVRKEHLKQTLGIPIKKKITSEELAKSFTWNKALPGNYRILTPLTTSHKSASSTKQLSREKFEGTARIIYNLNESRLQHKPFPICLSFEELSKTNADSKSKQMGEIWRILGEFCREKTVKVEQEQLFYESYHNGKDSSSLRKRIVQVSKATLEQQFFNYMDEIYTKDDKKDLSFQPASNVNKVSYFIHKVISKNNDSATMDKTLNFNGIPIWALLYYLLRSGLYSEAVELTNTNKAAFEKFDKNFPIYLSHFVKSDCTGLPSHLQERISADYGQNFHFVNEDSPDFDPYKYAVYKILGKCDLAKKNLPAALNLSIEDWLWFHLSIINEFNPDSASSLLYENYTLENLQNKVISLGPDKFNASSNNPVYAKTLIQLGLYELAVQYVFEQLNECDAVHLAIVLCYYGLLRTTRNNIDELIAPTSEGFDINFTRLVGSYTRSFKISDPKVAAQYLILICLAKGGHNKEETEKCHEALRELILISREFGLLLGHLNQSNGDKTPGILEKQRALMNLYEIESFYNAITQVSAQRCEEEGRVFDALKLYQLCQDYNTVVSLINKFLSELLSLTELDKSLLAEGSGQKSNGEIKEDETIDNNFVLLSKHLMTVFKSNSFILEKISPKEKEINEFLLPIVDIRESFVKKEWKTTLDSMKALGLVPIVDTEDYITIRRAADSLNGYDVSLVKVIPSLLIIVMTCVSQLNYAILTRRYSTGGQDKTELQRLKTIAKNCMVYAGMIQYRMPRETYSLLTNLESQL